ncbi:MAG: argininosuccinate lyase, partial [Longimicrobiales bacterium]
LQEDKALLFHAVDDLLALLPVTRETLAGLSFDEETLTAAVSDHALLATDLADALVRHGVPFREAHHAVGRLVRAAEARGVPLGALPASAFVAAHPAFTEGDIAALNAEASVEARGVAGGTGRRAVLAQLEDARRRLA